MYVETKYSKFEIECTHLQVCVVRKMILVSIFKEQCSFSGYIVKIMSYTLIVRLDFLLTMYRMIDSLQTMLLAHIPLSSLLLQTCQ